MLTFVSGRHPRKDMALDGETLLSGQFWGELRVFLAVAKAKSFNRAAELLSTSQPTVSRQVKRLQDVIGSQLLIPGQHGITLTPGGEDLAQALANLDQALFSLTNDLKGPPRGSQEAVRVSIADGLNAFFLAPALEQFSAEHPRIQIHLKGQLDVASLRDNQVDVMIGLGHADAPDLTLRRLGHLHFLPVASMGYVRKHGLPAAGHLEKHLFLQSELYGAQPGLWGAWLDMVAQGRMTYCCDNALAYGMLIKAGQGIGLVGSYAAIQLAAVPLEHLLKISLPLHAIARTDRLRSRPVRLVFHWLCEVFGANNPWLNEELSAHGPKPQGPQKGPARRLPRRCSS